MNKKYFKAEFLTVLLVSLIIYLSITYAVTTPRIDEEYFQMYILGKEKTADKYYPYENNRTIPLNTNVTWYIIVENYVRKPSLVLIKFKLGNSTTKTVDDSKFEPAEMPVIQEMTKVLLPDEKWVIVLTWKIVKIEKINGLYYLTLDWNGTKIPIYDLGSKYLFRFVIELWTYNNGKFILGWDSVQGRKIAWLQMWFEILI
jgi:uncharacterized membrane protein